MSRARPRPIRFPFSARCLSLLALGVFVSACGLDVGGTGEFGEAADASADGQGDTGPVDGDGAIGDGAAVPTGRHRTEGAIAQATGGRMHRTTHLRTRPEMHPGRKSRCERRRSHGRRPERQRQRTRKLHRAPDRFARRFGCRRRGEHHSADRDGQLAIGCSDTHDRLGRRFGEHRPTERRRHELHRGWASLRIVEDDVVVTTICVVASAFGFAEASSSTTLLVRNVAPVFVAGDVARMDFPTTMGFRRAIHFVDPGKNGWSVGYRCPGSLSEVTANVASTSSDLSFVVRCPAQRISGDVQIELRVSDGRVETFATLRVDVKTDIFAEPEANGPAWLAEWWNALPLVTGSTTSCTPFLGEQGGIFDSSGGYGMAAPNATSNESTIELPARVRPGRPFRAPQAR